MKKNLFLLCLVAASQFAQAQNVGVGIASPLQKMHVNGGNLLITQALSQTSSLPATGQTYTMVNGASTQYTAADSTGKMYDPGGPSANYIANLNAQINIPAATNCVGYEVTINTIDLGAGDSLVISELSNWRNVQLTIGNNFNEATGTFVFNTPTLFFTFKSNGDGLLGAGFEIIFKRKYDNMAAIPINNLAGNVFMYDAKYARLRIGNFNNSLNFPGASYSLSIGNSRVDGDYSMALGENNLILGSKNLAVGYGNELYGQYGAAFGFQNSLTGSLNFAFGRGLYGDAGIGSSQHTLYTGEYNTYPYLFEPFFVIGNGYSDAARSNALEVDRTQILMHNYTLLGLDAPAIKMKKLTLTSANAQGALTFVNHGLNRSKIISYTCLLDYGAGDIPPNYNDVPGFEYNVQTTATGFNVYTKTGNSGNILGRPIKVLIIYEQ